MLSDHVQAGGHIWDVSLHDVNRKVTVAFRLHWLLLKCLEHLLKLTKHKEEKKKEELLRRVEEVKM